MKIVVNGREYSNAEELPPEVRQDYERAMSTLADNNGNGIPDILEVHLDPAKLQKSMSEAREGVTMITSQKFVIDGREYESFEQMPPNVRRQFEQVQSLLPGSNPPPVRETLDPLNPAEWATNRGMLTTDPTTMIFVGIVIGVVVTAAAVGIVFVALRALQ